jgi:hypothetical protein
MTSILTSSSAKPDDPVFRGFSANLKGRGVLDTPLEPVIGLAEGETRWRGMTRRSASAEHGRA